MALGVPVHAVNSLLKERHKYRVQLQVMRRALKINFIDYQHGSAFIMPANVHHFRTGYNMSALHSYLHSGCCQMLSEHQDIRQRVPDGLYDHPGTRVRLRPVPHPCAQTVTADNCVLVVPPLCSNVSGELQYSCAPVPAL